VTEDLGKFWEEGQDSGLGGLGVDQGQSSVNHFNHIAHIMNCCICTLKAATGACIEQIVQIQIRRLSKEVHLTNKRRRLGELLGSVEGPGAGDGMVG
jgi:hypothetical protein